MTLRREIQIAWWHGAARVAGKLRRRRWRARPWPARAAEKGVSVVIPSRNGRHLLAAQLPAIAAELEPLAAEIVIVDNGSEDGTAEWLRGAWPQALVELSPEPLSFARAVNRGIARARFCHICLLNNDMAIAPGFFRELERPFARVPDLFCATAQIRFPEGVRRQETGKAVMAQTSPEDFPIRCDEPFPGEDGSYVLYGSGGCSLYDAARLRALGAVDEAYAPAYVEDLDLGYRAWQRGWPTVYVAGAVVEHRHRATTSRYFTEPQLEQILETNHLRFLARAVADPRLFRRLWSQALDRLRLLAGRSPAARHALRKAAGIALGGGPADPPEYSEELFLALTNGDVAVFPGQARAGEPAVLQAGQLDTPPPEVLAKYVEVVLVRAASDLALRAAQEWTGRKWKVG